MCRKLHAVIYVGCSVSEPLFPPDVFVRCRCGFAAHLQPLVGHTCLCACIRLNLSRYLCLIFYYCCRSRNCRSIWVAPASHVCYRATVPMENLHSALISSTTHLSFKKVAAAIRPSSFAQLVTIFVIRHSLQSKIYSRSSRVRICFRGLLFWYYAFAA